MFDGYAVAKVENWQALRNLTTQKCFKEKGFTFKFLAVLFLSDVKLGLESTA